MLLCSELALGALPNYSSIQVHQTGTLYETEGELPDEIEEFCKAGDPPIFIGFGSMMFRPADELMTMFINAAKKTGHRVVLGLGWAERLYQLGIGSRPVTITNLTEDRLAGMMRQVDSEEMLREARKIARRINPLRGMHKTAKRIVSVANRG